ncbi:MAG: universal stress protein [Burkholderiales bacterium]
MGTLGRIIVATDLTNFSVRVVERAAMIAAQVRSPLSVVHVMDAGSISAMEALTGAWTTARKSTALQRAESQLAESLERLRSRYHLDMDSEVIAGRPHTVVADMAEAHSVALVVIGAHSNEALRHTMLGTTGARMLRAIRKSILVVRSKSSEPYRGVLAAMDFSDAAVAAMQLAVRVVPSARLAVLHAINTHFDGLISLFGMGEEDLADFSTQARVDALAKIEALVAHLPDQLESVSPEVQKGKPADVILQRSRSADVDLVALGRHGPIRGLDVLVGGVARQIVNRSECDVLVSAVTGYEY